jgi:hypothetical protein
VFDVDVKIMEPDATKDIAVAGNLYGSIPWRFGSVEIEVKTAATEAAHLPR